MITKVDNTISFLKSLWVETFLNKTDKVTDITDNSVLNGIAYANAKVAQKCLKDIAIVEAQVFPEMASGEYLDRAAQLFGVTPRQGALGSSTYVRVFTDGSRDVTYEAGTHTFVNNDGVRFQIEETVTIPAEVGYGYVKVRSEAIGAFTNVDANTIINVTPVPQGHLECTNEYFAEGGRDQEDDEMFRLRILNHQNIYSVATLEKLVQVFRNIDDRVLKIMFVGVEEDSFLHIQIVTQNGQDLTQDELDELLENATPYFGIGDLIVAGGIMGIKLENASWYEVGGDTGVDFRCELVSGYRVADVRKNIQIGLSKYLDFRYWEAGQKVEWDDLLEIVKNTEGVKYVSSEWFRPNQDESVSEFMLPRIKKFRMRDMNGIIMLDEGTDFEMSFDDYAPVYYPA